LAKPANPSVSGSIFGKSAHKKYTIWLFNIAMGNGPFIDGLPIKNGVFYGDVK